MIVSYDNNSHHIDFAFQLYISLFHILTKLILVTEFDRCCLLPFTNQGVEWKRSYPQDYHMVQSEWKVRQCESWPVFVPVAHVVICLIVKESCGEITQSWGWTGDRQPGHCQNCSGNQDSNDYVIKLLIVDEWSQCYSALCFFMLTPKDSVCLMTRASI